MTNTTARTVVTKDGVRVSPVLESSNEAFAWLLKHQGQSVDYATRYGGYGFVSLPEMDETDAGILERRQALLDERQGPGVGDFVRFSDGTIRRISYDWQVVGMDGVQTSDEHAGSYYLGDGHVSYSGGLHPGISKETLEATSERRTGAVWFFHHDIRRAHNGVDTLATFDVYRANVEPTR